MQDPTEGLLAAIQDGRECLDRLEAMARECGTYSRQAFYESSEYLTLQLALALERSWTAIECLLEDLPE
jgi:hypothetical protein